MNGIIVRACDYGKFARFRATVEVLAQCGMDALSTLGQPFFDGLKQAGANVDSELCL